MRKNVNKIQGGGGPAQRNSNIELFRVITMLLIIAHHYVVNSGLLAKDGPIYTDLWSGKSLFLLVFGAFGKMGINCFVLITGYFMCTGRITVRKFLKLFLEVEFYKIAIYLLFAFTGYSTFSLSGFVKSLLPIASIGQNFVGCYLLFYLLIPFLNILIQQMNENQHLNLLLILVAIYVVIGTLLNEELVMNYITWFVVLYIVASYVRLYPKRLFENTKLWGVLTLCMGVVSVLSVIVCTYLVAFYHAGGVFYFMTDSNKILAFASAFCGFMFFKNVKIRNSKMINTIAASSFGVLLIHANSATMRQWLWEDVLGNVKMYGSDYLILHAFLSVIGIYLVCTVIDYARIQLLERPFFALLDKRWDKIATRCCKITRKFIKD